MNKPINSSQKFHLTIFTPTASISEQSCLNGRFTSLNSVSFCKSITRLKCCRWLRTAGKAVAHAGKDTYSARFYRKAVIMVTFLKRAISFVIHLNHKTMLMLCALRSHIRKINTKSRCHSTWFIMVKDFSKNQSFTLNTFVTHGEFLFLCIYFFDDIFFAELHFQSVQ